MAIVPRPRADGKTTHWIVLRVPGRKNPYWENGGTDARLAQRRERELKDQVDAGTFNPEIRGRVTVDTFLEYYLSKRKNRTVENDRALLRDHVRSIAWFASMTITTVRPRHILRVVETMREAGKLGEKSIATVYGLIGGAFRRAVFEDVITSDPCQLPKGTIKWKSRKKRVPYTRDELRALLACPKVAPAFAVWIAIAVYTGMREGEVCGRRWRDWRLDARPLTALHVHSQYDDQPLKTDDGEDTRPRTVPVHPELERILRAWWSDGFELVHGRPPTLEDFIVPTTRAQVNHTKSSAYKAFRRALAQAGVGNKSLHSTRHAFISIARSNGARKEVLETVTHNAAAAHETIDDYTEFEWRAVCESVGAFDVSFDPNAVAPAFPGSSSWTRSSETPRDAAETPRNRPKPGETTAPKIPAETPRAAAPVDASQTEADDFRAALAEHSERAAVAALLARPLAKVAKEERAAREAARG